MVYSFLAAFWACIVPTVSRSAGPEFSAIGSTFRYACEHRAAGQTVFLRLLAGRDSIAGDREELAAHLRQQGYPVWRESRVPGRDSVVLEVLPLTRNQDGTPTLQVFYLSCQNGQQYRSFAFFWLACDYLRCEVDEEVGSDMTLDQRTGSCDQYPSA